MEINNAMHAATNSIRQAISIATMKKMMNRDAQSVAALLEGMQAANAKTMEISVTPYNGSNIDIRI